MTDINKVKAGKAGAAATHKTRWDMLKYLSGHYDKKTLDYIMIWRTKQIKVLFDYVKKNKNNN